MVNVLAWIIDLPPILSSKWWAAALAIALAASVLAMVAASFTQWGRKKPLTKCIVATLLAHLWLLMYALSTNMPSIGIGSGGAADAVGLPSNLALEMMAVATEASESIAGDARDEPTELPRLWDTPLPLEVPEIKTAQAPTDSSLGEISAQAVDSRPRELPIDDWDPRKVIAATVTAAVLPVDTLLADLLQPEPELAEDPTTNAPPSNDPTTADVSADDRDQSAHPDNASRLDPEATSVAVPPPPAALPPAVQHVPDRYRLRFQPDRLSHVAAAGGDARTEAAVQGALEYLAKQQLPSGLFSSANSGGGRETFALGENRGGAGGKADAAITGLAALAFMGAGHVPSHGQFASECAAAIDALIRGQSADGCLAGSRQIGTGPDVRYAKMYSHAIALLALAECEAFVDDRRLHEAVARGVAYTLAAQNSRTGGWRYDAYFTGDPGDLSLYGWQAMALYSAADRHSAAAAALPNTYGFLERVAAGRSGGLAVYRPVPGQLPTASMTAEALACRHLFGRPIPPSAAAEAAAMLLSAPPGSGQDNLYYWYYATLAMKFEDGPAWEQWNAAIKRQLLNTQTDRGPTAGSWAPDGLWGGYGGRIYSTAMGALILEVYYRYLPILRGDAPEVRLSDRY